MALIDNGVLIYKNNKLINKDFLDGECFINGIKFSIYPKGFEAKYDDTILYDFIDFYHPYRKIIKKVKGVYFEIKRRDRITRIYIKNQNDTYIIFAGYGIDFEWRDKQIQKAYHYPKRILRELYAINKD